MRYALIKDGLVHSVIVATQEAIEAAPEAWKSQYESFLPLDAQERECEPGALYDNKTKTFARVAQEPEKIPDDLRAKVLQIIAEAGAPGAPAVDDIKITERKP